MGALIALTGGIGSGKSVVARLLRTLGYPVFDSDLEARALMDADLTIHRRLVDEICAGAVVDGRIDRAAIAAVVFSDSLKLDRLNAIVHGAVRERLAQWCQEHQYSNHAHGRPDILFVETAILFQSGLNRMVDAEWRVEAPDDLRVRRVIRRNGLSETQVRERIASQVFTPADDEPQPPLDIILNDNVEPILPRVIALLADIDN